MGILSYFKLTKAVSTIIHINLAIQPQEKVLIVTDTLLEPLAYKFVQACKKIAKTDILVIPVARVNGEEPSACVSEAMKLYDVELLITTKSLTHTNARREASKFARIATLPGIMQKTLERAIDIDYGQMNVLNKKWGELMNSTSEVRIISDAGSDLTFSIKGRKASERDDGIIIKKGQYGNLPAGESYIAPLENSANGVLVVDGSIASIGFVDCPVIVNFKNGKATSITGGDSAAKWSSILDSYGEKARFIGEFGIGTNPKAVLCGNLLEDEKAMGTCHIALGNNTGFGGTNDVALHMDAVIRNPTIYFDKKKIMESGRFLF